MATLTVKIAESRTIRVFYLWILIICLTGCSFSDSTPSKSPIAIPIVLSKAGNVYETDFQVNKDDKEIYFLLKFYVDNLNKNRVLNFLGYSTKFGVTTSINPIPIEIKVFRYVNNKKTEIIEKTYTIDNFRDGSGKEIIILYGEINKFNFKEGKYRVLIETIRDFPQLYNIPIEFQIYHFRPIKLTDFLFEI